MYQKLTWCPEETARPKRTRCEHGSQKKLAKDPDQVLSTAAAAPGRNFFQYNASKMAAIQNRLLNFRNCPWYMSVFICGIERYDLTPNYSDYFPHPTKSSQKNAARIHGITAVFTRLSVHLGSGLPMLWLSIHGRYSRMRRSHRQSVLHEHPHNTRTQWS